MKTEYDENAAFLCPYTGRYGCDIAISILYIVRIYHFAAAPCQVGGSPLVHDIVMLF